MTWARNRSPRAKLTMRESARWLVSSNPDRQALPADGSNGALGRRRLLHAPTSTSALLGPLRPAASSIGPPAVAARRDRRAGRRHARRRQYRPGPGRHGRRATPGRRDPATGRRVHDHDARTWADRPRPGLAMGTRGQRQGMRRDRQGRRSVRRRDHLRPRNQPHLDLPPPGHHRRDQAGGRPAGTEATGRRGGGDQRRIQRRRTHPGRPPRRSGYRRGPLCQRPARLDLRPGDLLQRPQPVRRGRRHGNVGAARELP